jgi:hypothetical protein
MANLIQARVTADASDFTAAADKAIAKVNQFQKAAERAEVNRTRLTMRLNVGANAAIEKSRQAAREKEKLEAKSAKSAQISAGFEKQSLAYSKAATRAAFEGLSHEDKRTRLLAKQAQLQMLIARMEGRGNVAGASAHRAALGGVSSQLSSMAAGGFAGGFMARFGGAGSAGLAGGIGGALAGGVMRLGSILASLPMRLAGGILRTGLGAIQEGDRISDTAENYRMKPEEYYRYQKAASFQGVRRDRSNRILQALDQSRASALGGDPKSIGDFTKYGIDRKTLESGGLADIGTLITKNLGAGGATNKDIATLSRLMGRNYAGGINTFRRYGATREDQGMGGTLSTLDRAGLQVEKAADALKQITMQKTAEALTSPGQAAYDTALMASSFFRVGWGPLSTLVNTLFKPSPRKQSQELYGPPAPDGFGLGERNVKPSMSWRGLPFRGTESDTLTQIGGTRGGESASIQRRQLAELQKIVSELQILSAEE